MKKLLVLLGALSISAVAYGQGQISFNNFGGAPAGRILLNGSTTTGPSTASFVVELLAGSSASTLASVYKSTASVWLGTGTSSGYFDSGVLTSLAAGNYSFQVRVYDGSSFASPSTQSGASAVFTGTVGAGAPAPPASFPSFSGFTLQLIPEPSTMALGLLAGAGLLALRRRKAA